MIRTRRVEFDKERLELRVNGRAVLRFYREVGNQVAILRIFEDLGWPAEVDNVLGRPGPLDPKHRLSDAVCALNLRQKMIHFWVIRGTRAVRWEFTGEIPGHQPRPVRPRGE